MAFEIHTATTAQGLERYVHRTYFLLPSHRPGLVATAASMKGLSQLSRSRGQYQW
jgi:hypothetical protein